MGPDAYRIRKQHERARQNAAARRIAAEDAAKTHAGAAIQASASYDANGDVFTVYVPSQTEPERLTYKVQARGDVATCNCRGYASHRHCKHASAVLALLKEPAKEPAQ